MTKTDQDREDFEAWTDAQCSDETRALWMLRRGTSYAHPVTRGAWEAWQAALAHERARAQGGPVAWVNESYRDSILEHTGKVYWHGPMMCGKEFKGSFPVYLAAPARPVAVPVDILQRDAARWRSLARNTGGEEDLTRDPNSPHTLHIKIDVSGCEVWINDKIDFVGTLEKAIDAEIAEFGLEAAAPSAPAAEVPPSALNEPDAWWAETGTSGAGEGCNKPFWLRHEAIAYVRRHGGHVAPLFRRWSTAPAAARSAAEEMRERCAKFVLDARGEFGSVQLAERIMGIPLPGEEA